MKRISIIVATASDGAIGKNNNLLWHIPSDLKRFKKLTTNNVVVMGRKTFESLPKGALPNRKNIVISNNTKYVAPNCTMAYSIKEAISLMDGQLENFIIGGAAIYKAFSSIAQKLYLTKVTGNYEADTYFSGIDYSLWAKEHSESFPGDDISPAHIYEIYSLKNNCHA